MEVERAAVNEVAPSGNVDLRVGPPNGTGHLIGKRIEGDVQRAAQRGDGEERRRRNSAGLDLAQSFDRDACCIGDVGHGSATAGMTESRAEPGTAGEFAGGEGNADHDTDSNTGRREPRS